MIEKIIMALGLFFTGGTMASDVSDENMTKNIEIKSSSVIETKWDDLYSENGYESFESIIETKDGGFIAVGQTTILEGGSTGDGLIIKYNKNGEIEWQNALLGEDTDIYYSVAENTESGDLFVVGKTYSSDVGFENSTNISNAIIYRYSSDGEEDELIHNSSDSGKQVNYNDIIVLDNKLYIVGDKMNEGSRTGFLKIIDINDAQNESIIYLQDENLNTNINSIIKTKDSSVILVGNYIDKNTSEEIPLVMKMNKDGSDVWNYGLSSNKEGSFNSVVELPDGGFVATGYQILNGIKSLNVTSLGSDGKFNWNKVESREYVQIGNSVVLNENNELVITVEKTVSENVNLSENLEISLKRYSIEGDVLEDTMLSNDTNVKHMKSIYTSENMLLVVGRKYVVAESVMNCSARNNAECLQSDAYIVMVGIKDPCDTNEVPIIELKDDKVTNSKVTININDEFNPLDYVIATDEGKDVTDNVAVTPEKIDTSIKGEQEITYTISDECSVKTVQLILVVVDPCDTYIIPSLEVTQEKVVININEEFNSLDYVMATDSNGVDMIDRVTVNPKKIDTSVKGEQEITYSIEHECGINYARLTLVVVDPCDTDKAPTIEIKQEKVTIRVGEEFNALDYVVATDEGKDITDSVVSKPNKIDTSTEGEYEIEYSVRDNCNLSTGKLILVVEDPCSIDKKPVIEVINEIVEININDEFNPLDYINATHEGEDIKDNVIITPEKIDTSIKGEQEITFEIASECGIVSSKMVLIVQDPCDTNDAPIINLKEKVVYLEVEQEFNPMDYVIATDEGKDVTESIEIKFGEDFDLGKEGTYDITYTIKDECSVVEEKMQVVVKQNPCKVNELPVINVNDKVIINIGDKYDPLDGITATDKEDGDITDKIVVSGDTINTSIAGEYEVKYEIVDDCGAIVDKVIVVVVVDNSCETNEIPVINGSNVTIQIGDKFNPMDRVTAADKELGDITDKIEVIKNTVDTSVAGEYEVVYRVVDECSTVEKVIKVTIEGEKVVGGVEDENEDKEETKKPSTTVKPQTGDNTYVYVVLIVVCIAGIMIINKKKNNQ